MSVDLEIIVTLQ